jgi:hypothetical protein
MYESVCKSIEAFAKKMLNEEAIDTIFQNTPRSSKAAWEDDAYGVDFSEKSSEGQFVTHADSCCCKSIEAFAKKVPSEEAIDAIFQNTPGSSETVWEDDAYAVDFFEKCFED